MYAQLVTIKYLRDGMEDTWLDEQHDDRSSLWTSPPSIDLGQGILG
jgi:hypothetical protein